LATDPGELAAIVRAVRPGVRLPLWVKLSPNVGDVAAVGRAAEAAGADALSAINTLRGLAIDLEGRRPRLASGSGGLSGPAIKPAALSKVCLGFASSESGVPSPNVHLYLRGGLPPSVSALNCTSRGALPSSGSASAQARSGAASSACPAAVVVGPPAAAGGAAGAVDAVGAFGVSLGPPPHPGAPSATRATSRAEQASLPFMKLPPGPKFVRRRILTDGLQAVKLWPLATLLPLALGAGASWAVPTRGDLRLLAVLAAFPDRPLDHDRQSFMVLMDRFVAYYREVS